MNGRFMIAELQVVRRDRPMLLACLLAALLSFYASTSGARWQDFRDVSHRERATSHAASTKAEAEQLQAIERGQLTIAEAAAVGLPHLVRTEFSLPSTVLSGLAIGDSELRPTYAAITATTRNHEIFRFQEVENPIILGIGRFDFSFVLIYLLPLLIVGLGSTVLSNDRENFSLQTVLSQPITAGRLAALRVTLRTTLLVFSALLGLAISLPIHGAGLLDASSALAWFVLVIMAYCVFWWAITLWIVALNRKSETNAMLMVVSWMVIVLLVPTLTSIIAKEVSPMPSRLEYIVSARAAENSANLRSRDLLQTYLLDHPELGATSGSAVSPFVKTFFLVQNEIDRSVEPVVRRFDAAEEAQRQIRGFLRWLSPRDIAEESLLLATGNSSLRFAAFESQARALRGQWRAAVESALISGRRLTLAEFEALPRPAFSDVSHAEIAKRNLVGVLFLLLLSALIGLDARRRLAAYVVV